MTIGNNSILRIHGGFGRNLTRFDLDKNKVINRWSMFSNADLNIYEQLILNEPNEKNIWKISKWNFTLPNDFYSGYSFVYQNDFYFVTHSNGILNRPYELFKVDQLDNLESLQACLDFCFEFQPCSHKLSILSFGQTLGTGCTKLFPYQNISKNHTMVYPESCFMNYNLDILAVNTQNPTLGKNAHSQFKTSLDILNSQKHSSHIEIPLDATALRNAACSLEYL